MTTLASLQPPIDEEIIKIEEVLSSSSNNVTANSPTSSVDAIDVKRDITDIRVKKEEEEVDDDEDNNRNDGTSTSNQNYDLDRSVKKEEEVENNDDDGIKITCKEVGAQCDDDYDYSDWKVGDWCWVLPADKNTQQLTSGRSVKSEDGGTNTSTSTAVISVNNTITNDSSSASSIRNRTTRETKTKRATRSIDDESAPAADEASSRPKKKKRTNDDASSDNNNSNTTKQKEENIEERNYLKNTDVSSTADNGVDSISSNDDDDDDDDCNEDLFEESNSDKDDGYESWTKGNWCWLLPRLHSVGKMNETKQHPHGLCATERTAITRSRSSRRRCRRSQSSSAHVEVGGENENKLDEDYVERDDDEDDNDHNSSRRIKARRNTMGHTEYQNERWNQKFQRLVTYKKEFNSTSVPYQYKEDLKLGIWTKNQRSYYSSNKLSETRVGRLDSIGFAWNPLGEKWMEMYHKLVAYKKSNRSTKVPQEDLELGNWVRHQREFYKNKTISIERTHRLESIGFAWDQLDEQWMEMYHKLVAYKKSHRSTKVPRRYTEDLQLGSWVYGQRRCYRKNKLTEKRTELLNSINFVWSVR